MFLRVVLFIIISSVLSFAQKEGDIRLISKRLEIFYNQTWGTVCDDSFDDIDANVACKQLGYNDGITLGSTVVDDGSGEIWLDDMECVGNERKLVNCPNNGWGKENCGHSEDVGVECFNTYDGKIKLESGVIWIFHNERWGTVCDDSFDDIDAQVACRQLGYNNGIFNGSTVTTKEMKIWLDNVDCIGDEATLAHCPNAGWGVEDCNRGENVNIKCNNKTDGDLRLTSGKLEILHNNEWGTICSDNFDNIAAKVACKQLGSRNGNVSKNAVVTGTSRIWLNKLRCNGGETKLCDCSHTDWGKQTCSHGNVAGIRCDGNGDVRLNSDRLEIYYNETWGTVCDNYFDDREATVACRQLGYNSGKVTGSKGNGTGMVWLSYVSCTGLELKLSDCSDTRWGGRQCSHTRDVRIECLNPDDGDLRIISNRLEIFHINEWGGVCREDFNHTDAIVACRQLGYRSGYVRGYSSYVGGKIWLAAVHCNGEEKKLASCQHAEWGENDCKYIVDIRCHNEILGGYECSKEGSIKWACEYLVHIVAGVAAGSILTTVLFGLVCQVIASRIRTQKKDQPYSNTLKTDKPTREYDGVVAFQNVSNEAIVPDEIYDIVE